MAIKFDKILGTMREDDSSLAHSLPASSITYNNATSGMTAADVQAALDELDGRVDLNDAKIGNVDTNLTTTQTTTTVDVVSSDGTDATLPQAIASGNAGVMSGADKAKLDGIESGATADMSDAEIKTAYENNANTNEFSDSEKSKLAGLDGSRFLGEYATLGALQSAHPSPQAGSYANVDAGIGSDVIRYVWDSDDTAYIEQLGVSTLLTDAQIKTQYENNANTNAFTDSNVTTVGHISVTSPIDLDDIPLANLEDLSANSIIGRRGVDGAGAPFEIKPGAGANGLPTGRLEEADWMIGWTAAGALTRFEGSTVNTSKTNLNAYFATLGVDADSYDTVGLTAMTGPVTVDVTTGSYIAASQRLTIRLTDDGTARAITWNAIYRDIGIALPSTTVVGETLYAQFMYNATDTKWDLINVSQDSGGGASPLTTKGDLYTYDTGDQRLAVGGNGDSLIADSTEATGLKWKKNNTSATAAPTATDDSASGYEVGSVWIDVTNDAVYTCVDATASAAVWIGIGNGNTTATATHTITGWQSVNYQEAFNHNFAGVPDWVHAVAVCKAANNGYAIDDEIDLKSTQNWVSTGEIGCMLNYDATQVEFIGANNANPLRGFQRDGTNDNFSLQDTDWDVKITAYKGGVTTNTDSNAIHDNVDGEIAAITAKATPVNADVLLIEDSAASNAKKKVTFENLKDTINASGQPSLSKAILIEEPTATEDLTLFYTNVAITIQEIRAVSTGTTPSTTYQIKTSSLDRGGAGTNVTSSGTTTSTSLGDTASVTTAAVPSGSWVWLESTAASGTNVTLSINIRYTED